MVHGEEKIDRFLLQKDTVSSEVGPTWLATYVPDDSPWIKCTYGPLLSCRLQSTWSVIRSFLGLFFLQEEEETKLAAVGLIKAGHCERPPVYTEARVAVLSLSVPVPPRDGLRGKCWERIDNIEYCARCFSNPSNNDESTRLDSTPVDTLNKWVAGAGSGRARMLRSIQ